PGALTMDRRTTIALLLCLVVFAVFTTLQARFAPKPKPHPVAGAPANGVAGESTRPAPTPSAPAPGAGGGAPLAPPSRAAPPAPAVPEQLFVLETPLYRATFGNLGARLRSFELKRYAAAWGESRYADHPDRRPKRGSEVPAGDRVELAGEPALAFDL